MVALLIGCVSLKQGFSNFLFCDPIFKKFFLGDPLMDILDINDTCKCPIDLQKRICLSIHFFRDPKIIFPQPIVWEALL